MSCSDSRHSGGKDSCVKVVKEKKKAVLLDNIMCNYDGLVSTSDDPDSLEQTESEQNAEHSLTHINDPCAIFVLLTSCFQQSVTKESFNVQQQDIPQLTLEACLKSPKSWNNLLPGHPASFYQIYKDN